MMRGESTYQYLSDKNNVGMFYYTDCCQNRIYSINNDPMFYHGKLCPKCFVGNKLVTLYLRGTEEGIRALNRNSIEADKEVDNG